MPRFLYIRGLRQVDHTVFGVADGQKFFFSPINGQRQPYASGQQVKRSILDAMIDLMPDEQRAPITFNYELSAKKKGADDTISQKEPWNPCDPSYADQLVGGWMRAQKGSPALRRRSPLSISAMRPLHHSLANLENKENGTFDRSDQPEQHKIVVRDEKGNELSEEQIQTFLSENNRSLPMRNWLDLGSRVNGLFIYDIAVDLEKLFSVSTNKFDAALTDEMVEQLKEQGWTDTGNELVAPEAMQEKIIDALAEAIVNWRITSNQSRTFSPQGTMAIAVSTNANRIVNAIRADLRDDQVEGRQKADPVIDTSVRGTEIFVAPVARGFIPGITVNPNATDDAMDHIKSELRKAILSSAG